MCPYFEPNFVWPYSSYDSNVTFFYFCQSEPFFINTNSKVMTDL